MTGQTILFDADDTLWENNIFFERTIEAYISALAHLGYTREDVRQILNETERDNVLQHGYGVQSFRRSLEDTYRKLAGERATPELLEQIAKMALALEQIPPHIIEGVPETLAYLREHHRLILLSKGAAAEQAAKVESSGLQAFFEAIEIVAEKNAAAYERVVRDFRIAKEDGWMVGNSPRSDINPALQAGLNAVFIPHTATWELEKCELGSGSGKLLIVSRFAELRAHF